jgi:hypothetical protein
MNRMSSATIIRETTKKGAIIFAAALCLLIGCMHSAFADQVTMLFGGAGTSWNDGSDYVGPYTVSIGGTPSQLVCDDNTTEVPKNQGWTANAYTPTSVSDLTSNLGNLKFGGLNGATPDGIAKTVQNYEEVFYLTYQLMQGTNQASTPYMVAIHHTIWGIMDPGAFSSTGSNTDPTTTVYWLDKASDNLGWVTADISDFTIYTPTPSGASQEFIGYNPVPIPTSALLLAPGLIGLVGFRKRVFSRNND